MPEIEKLTPFEKMLEMESAARKKSHFRKQFLSCGGYVVLAIIAFVVLSVILGPYIERFFCSQTLFYAPC